MTSPLNYVFVYGTLLEGQGNHRLLQSSYQVTKQAVTKERFIMFGHGFPLCRRPYSDEEATLAGFVKGEVYGVTGAVLKDLDRLEGHPTFYERRVTPIVGYPQYNIWMYHWANDRGIITKGRVVPKDITDELYWPERMEQ